MKNIVWGQLLIAIATTVSFVGIGISLGFKNSLGVIVCLLLAIMFMGLGFRAKRKIS